MEGFYLFKREESESIPHADKRGIPPSAHTSGERKVKDAQSEFKILNLEGIRLQEKETGLSGRIRQSCRERDAARFGWERGASFWEASRKGEAGASLMKKGEKLGPRHVNGRVGKLSRLRKKGEAECNNEGMKK